MTQNKSQKPVSDDIASILACRDMLDAQPVPPRSTEQEPVAYNKTEVNGFVQDLYDKKMQEGKHGHYETMFHCVHQAIAKVTPPQRTWVGLDHQDKKKFSSWLDSKTDDEVFTAIDDLLRNMNT